MIIMPGLTHTAIAPPPYGGAGVAPPLGLVEETISLSMEQDRLNRHLANKPVG